MSLGFVFRGRGIGFSSDLKSDFVISLARFSKPDKMPLKISSVVDWLLLTVCSFLGVDCLRVAVFLVRVVFVSLGGGH